MNNKKMTVIIVDDDIDYLAQLKLYTENMGFSVLTAETQAEGEKLFENFKPDLAIFDLMIDKHDSGFILSYKLKQKYPDVPIIILTAVTSETGIQFGLDDETAKNWIKADLYLEKAVRPDQLHREINKLLNL
jgi:DNA-binding response OmpR family regulator